MNSIKHDADSMTDVQQPNPLKRKRILRDESFVNVVEDVSFSPSIIKPDRTSNFDMVNLEAFEEPEELFALDSASRPDSLILLRDESGAEIEMQEHARVRCFR
jgi:hypothetical protein